MKNRHNSNLILKNYHLLFQILNVNNLQQKLKRFHNSLSIYRKIPLDKKIQKDNLIPNFDIRCCHIIFPQLKVVLKMDSSLKSPR